MFNTERPEDQEPPGFAVTLADAEGGAIPAGAVFLDGPIEVEEVGVIP